MAANLSWLCPEDIGVGGSVALPVVVDKPDGDEPDIIIRVVVAIKTLGIETAQLLADEVIQILRHIVADIVFFRLLRLVVPVGSLAA